MLLPRPAPVSTTTRWPPSTSARTPAGVSATRCSPGLISRGTPTITTTPPSQRTPEEAGEPSLEARGHLALAGALDEIELRGGVGGRRGPGAGGGRPRRRSWGGGGRRAAAGTTAARPARAYSAPATSTRTARGR